MAEKFQKGDWVAEAGVNRPCFGMIRQVWQDGSIDIIMYAYTGERVGRVSPPEGGPVSFEPCCTAEHYAKIDKPQFPLKTNFGCWRKSLKFI